MVVCLKLVLLGIDGDGAVGNAGTDVTTTTTTTTNTGDAALTSTNNTNNTTNNTTNTGGATSTSTNTNIGASSSADLEPLLHKLHKNENQPKGRVRNDASGKVITPTIFKPIHPAAWKAYLEVPVKKVADKHTGAIEIIFPNCHNQGMTLMMKSGGVGIPHCNVCNKDMNKSLVRDHIQTKTHKNKLISNSKQKVK